MLVRFVSSCSYLVGSVLGSMNPTWFRSLVQKWVRIRDFGCCEFGFELVNDDFRLKFEFEFVLVVWCYCFVMLIWDFGLIWKIGTRKNTWVFLTFLIFLYFWSGQLERGNFLVFAMIAAAVESDFFSDSLWRATV